MPRSQNGPPRRAQALLDCAGVPHRFHTPGMRPLYSLARSKIVSANCAGYIVTDPNPHGIKEIRRLWERETDASSP